jgi:hypothetical protein
MKKRGVKEFKYLVNNIPEFVYKEKDEKSTSKKRELNPKDVEVSEKILKEIKTEEFKKTIPEKSIDEIELQRSEFSKKDIEKETNKLLKMLQESGEDGHLKDMGKLLKEIENKDKEIEKFNEEKKKKEKEISEKSKLKNKKFKEDEYGSLLRDIKILENKIEKENDLDNIAKMKKELSFSKEKLQKITDEQKSKSEEIQKEVEKLNESLIEMNDGLKKFKLEKNNLDKKKDILKEDLKMYEGVASFYRGIIQKSQEAKKYERSISVQRNNLIKEKEKLLKEIKEKNNDIKKTDNPNLKNNLKEEIKVKKDYADFLSNAIEELQYFLTSDGDVLDLSEKKQKEYLEDNLKAIQDQAIKMFPDLLYKWVENPEVIKKIDKIQDELKKLKDKKELTDKDRREIERYKEEMDKLKLTSLKKVRVDEKEGLAKLEKIREYFLTPQEVNGELYNPKKNLITREDYLDFLKKYDDKLKKIERISEEGMKRDKYLKEIYLIPTLLDFGDISEKDIKERDINDVRPLSIFKQDSSTSKDKKAPFYEATVMTEQLFKNTQDLKKIKSQYENYIDLFNKEDKGKWKPFFEKIEKTSSIFSDLLDELKNNKILELSEKEENLDIEKKEKIWKNKRDEFLGRFNKAMKDFKEVVNKKSGEEQFEKFMNLRRRSFDINSYLKNYDISEFDSSKIDYDYLNKKLDEISSKIFKNKEDLASFINSENYSYKNSNKLNLEDFIKKLEDDVKKHHELKEKKRKEDAKEKEKENKKFDKDESYLWKNLKPSYGIKAGSILLKTENSILYKIEKMSFMINDPFIKLELESISNKLKTFI